MFVKQIAYKTHATKFGVFAQGDTKLVSDEVGLLLLGLTNEDGDTIYVESEVTEMQVSTDEVLGEEGLDVEVEEGVSEVTVPDAPVVPEELPEASTKPKGGNKTISIGAKPKPAAGDTDVMTV